VQAAAGPGAEITLRVQVRTWCAFHHGRFRPMIEALTMPAILLALAISGAVIVAAELLRALDLTAGVRS
jgi:hypothetical protein